MLEKLINLDRRYIFLIIALTVIIPMLLTIKLPVPVSARTQSIYDFLESSPENTPIMFAFDYGPGSMAELQPMAIAMLHHAFRKKLKVIGMALWPEGAGLGYKAVQKVAQEYDAVEGEDYVFLGFRPRAANVLLLMGEDIRKAFAVDYRNVAIDEIPMMKDIKNYDDIALVITFGAGSPGPDTWVAYANARFDQKIATGVTGVIVSQLYPYLDTGQLIGLMRGMRGAAEYETLINRLDEGSKGMSIQFFVHIVFILMILFCNIAYFIIRRREVTTERR